MPPLDEGSLLFMPSLLPAASLTQAQDVIARQDSAIRFLLAPCLYCMVKERQLRRQV